jgi:hypothetical protein
MMRAGDLKLQAGSENKVSMQEFFTRRSAGVMLCAALALALGAVACDDDPAPLYEIPGSGSVEGLVFLDADRDGRFDPSAGDVLLPNVNVRLRVRGTQQILANGETQTDANGRFELTNVAVGTHDLAIDTAGLGGIVAFCQNPIPVNIFLNEEQFQPVAGRGGCVITIAEAEQQVDDLVTIRGTVTSFPGQLRSSYTYIEDNTGGIRIFSGVLEGQGIEIGDELEVSGTLLLFSGDLQLGNTVALNELEKAGEILDPQMITTGGLAAAGLDPASPELGVLVTIEKARIETVFGEGALNGRNVWIDDGSGRAQVRFETTMFPAASTDAAEAALTAAYPVGKCYDITGVTGAFNGDGQVFPRSLDDIVEVPCS